MTQPNTEPADPIDKLPPVFMSPLWQQDIDQAMSWADRQVTDIMENEPWLGPKPERIAIAHAQYQRAAALAAAEQARHAGDIADNLYAIVAELNEIRKSLDALAYRSPWWKRLFGHRP